MPNIACGRPSDGSTESRNRLGVASSAAATLAKRSTESKREGMEVGRAAPDTIPHVPDEKPPRLAGDERSTLHALLQYQRDSFARKLEGVTEEDAARSPLGSGTSLLWLANHIADAEATWILGRFARSPGADRPDPPAPTVTGAVARYRLVCERCDGVITGADLEDLCPPFDDQPRVNLRWILVHLLEETARHAGHADILRELIDGVTGR